MEKQIKFTDVLEPKEMKGILAIVALNKIWPKKEIRRKWNFGDLSVEFHWRSRNNLWGRFGGGWNWALGFTASKSCVLFNLLVFTIKIWKSQKEK